jgi:sugar lactone lactonase YvrE
MVEMPSGPARAPLIAPSLVRRYGLRSAMVFVGMVVALGAGAGLLREARTDVQIIVGEKDGESGPVISTWLETPGGMTIDRNGDIYIADSNNDVIVHADPSRINNRPVAVAGIQGRAGFSGDDGPALKALLDTPDGVCIAPDGDLVVADSRNDRIRRIDKPTRVITTIAGSGENGYDGDEKTATAAALNTPSAVACAPNGDIYIADMLNYRVRVLEARTGLIHTVAGDGTPGDINNIGDGGPAPAARLNMPADVQIAPNGDIYIADWHHNRIRKVDAKTRVISTVAGSGTFGPGGDDGPATQANLAGPTGIALVPEPEDQITIFIADFYNGQVRAVGPDGIMRNVSDEGRVAFGAPSRVAFALGPKKPGWLYVSDANSNNIVAVNIPRTLSGPILVPRALPAAAPAPKRGGE